MAQFVERYAVNQFNKEFKIATSSSDGQKQVFENISALNNIYRPRRCYKSKSVPSDDKQTRVQVTLLEYGQRGTVKNIVSIDSTDEESMEEQNKLEVNLMDLMKRLHVFFVLVFHMFCNCV